MTAHPLLLDALLLPLPQASDAWREWRSAIDIEQLDHASVHFLPALAGQLPGWLLNDPKQAIFLGICRRAWARNQVVRKLLSDTIGLLNAAGIERAAVTGPADWSARFWPDGAIRPLGRLDLLVEPAAVRAAIAVLADAGWVAAGAIPDTAGSKFYFAPGIRWRSPSGDDLRLHWRALPNTDLALRRPVLPACEQMIPVEYSLVAALGGMCEDEIDWQCDALLISRQAGIRWEKVTGLLRWRTKARERLEELRRQWNVEIPHAVSGTRWTGPAERLLATALRAYRRSRL
jgi:hypothetical protein